MLCRRLRHSPASAFRRYRASPGFGENVSPIPLQTVEELLGLPVSLPARVLTTTAPQPPPGAKLTTSMRDVLRVVTRLAGTGAAMPNNPILGDLAAGRGRSSVLRALRRLVRAKVITIERRGSKRRITIIETGKQTGWGDARPGHSPYIHRRPGEAAVKLVPVRGPASRPLPVQVAYQPPPAVDPAAAQVRILAADFAASCQMPLWADGVSPGSSPRFCGLPSDGKHSFCIEHVALCFRPTGQGRSSTPIPRQLDKSRTGRPGERVNAGFVFDTDAVAALLGAS